MSDPEIRPKRGKLPPLELENGETLRSVDHTPRKKKRKPQQPSESDNEEPKRRAPPPRRPVSSRSAESANLDSDGAKDSARDQPPRPRKPKPKPKTVEIDASDNEEVQAETPRPKKKRKPKPKSESQEELTENGHMVNEESTGSKPKKKKRKPRVGHGQVGLEAELYELEEDVLDEPIDDTVNDNYMPGIGMRSEPVNKLFIEQRSGFRSTNKAKIAKKRAEEQNRAMEIPDNSQTKNTIQFAISSHRVFKTIVLFLQGLLAGICMWQILTVYMLKNQGYDVLLEQYYRLAMPVQAMYYFLFALSTVAVFDRNDITRPTRRFVLRSVTLQSGAIACFFYLAGLVFSLASARTDDKIGLFKKQPELWEDIDARDKELSTWVILNLIRGLMPILGWFVISLRPNTDRLIKNLEKCDENILGDEGVQQIEGNGAVRSSGV